jgi:hypothetical protein
MRSRACGDSEREKGVCESVVTEDKLDSRLAAHRGPALAQAPEAPTVLGSATLSPLCKSDACYMFMYPSSFQLVYGRPPPFARRHHRLFDSGPHITRGHTPSEHQAAGPTVLGSTTLSPSLTHTCSCTRHHSSWCMVDPRPPPVGITGSSTAARPSTPGHPPPAPQALRFGTHHRRGGGQSATQSKFAARTSTVNGWRKLGPLHDVTINFSRCWCVLVGRRIDDSLFSHHLGVRAAAL